MKPTAKTIRFYNTHKDQVALEAFMNYADYGFSSANEMAVTALYKLAEQSSASTEEIPLGSLADKIVERLKGCINIVAGSSEAIGPTENVSSGPEIWDAPDNVNDADLSDVMGDILSF